MFIKNHTEMHSFLISVKPLETAFLHEPLLIKGGPGKQWS